MPALIDLVDAQLLKVAAPETPVQLLAQWPDPIKLGCQRFGIDGIRPVAALLAQAAHESGGFQKLTENLNYSAGGLARTWPHRYAINPGASPAALAPNALAYRLQHNPEAIANNCYANRNGNGDEASGDGWRYRGAGLFELTGAANQEAFGDSIGMPLADVPAYLQTPNGAAMSACWFFKMHGLEDLAITPGCADETRVINGGEIGLADRTQRFNAVVAELLRRGA